MAPSCALAVYVEGKFADKNCDTETFATRSWPQLSLTSYDTSHVFSFAIL